MAAASVAVPGAAPAPAAARLALFALGSALGSALALALAAFEAAGSFSFGSLVVSGVLTWKLCASCSSRSSVSPSEYTTQTCWSLT